MNATAKRKSLFVRTGDLLRSNPFSGYWVASVVLATQERTDEFRELCLVGVTSTVLSHEFTMDDLGIESLKLLRQPNSLQVEVPCIYIYAAKLNDTVSVVGNIDSSRLYSEPLRFEIGDGQNGKWPSCGKLVSSLGYQSVHAWRKINDYEQWSRDVQAARQSHQEMIARLKAKAK
jgi:hypothetical protein